MISFCKKVKKELCTTEVKIKNCCGYSFIYGFMLCGYAAEDKTVIKALNSDVGEYFIYLCQQLNIKKEYDYKYEKNRVSISSKFFRYFGYDDIKKNVLRCGKCKENFLKGLFLAIGSVTDPEKSYRLELVFDKEDNIDGISNLLLEMGIETLITDRGGKKILYLRKSEAIEDFFANIGATSLAFDIMNSKINKELINNANRITNCDAANINKAISASNKYNTVINQLVETENVNLLPPHLQEMARMRIEYKELSFSDLGKQFSPPISKSGVHHRLEKILEFYNDLKEKKLI